MAESSSVVSFPITLHNEHRLIFTRDVFAPENLTLAQTLTPREPGERIRALVFWDAGLEKAFPGIPAVRMAQGIGVAEMHRGEDHALVCGAR